MRRKETTINEVFVMNFIRLKNCIRISVLLGMLFSAGMGTILFGHGGQHGEGGVHGAATTVVGVLAGEHVPLCVLLPSTCMFQRVGCVWGVIGAAVNGHVQVYIACCCCFEWS